MRNASLYSDSAEASSPSMRFTKARASSAAAAEESFADGERCAEEWPRLRFPGLAEFPRELSEMEEGGGKLPPKTAIAARRDYCRAKGFDGGGLVSMSPCDARCIKPLGKQ